MFKRTIGILVLLFIISCGSYRKSNDVLIIKGKTKIVFNKIDSNLDSKSIVSGYVYSIGSQKFLKNASVKIGTELIETDSNGFFKVKVEPGIYTIKASFLGNTAEEIKKIKLEKNHSTIILFELGMEAIVCY